MQQSRKPLSRSSHVATVVVVFLAGVGTSVVAWWGVLSEEGRTMSGSDSPGVFVLVALSLMLFVGAELSGSFLLWDLRWSGRTVMRVRAAVVLLIVLYGTAATTVFALTSASVWALGAIVPGAFLACVVYLAVREWRDFHDREARVGGAVYAGDV